MVSYHPQLSKSICVERRGEKILNSKDTDGWKDEHLVQEAEDSLAEKEHQNCQKFKKKYIFNLKITPRGPEGVANIFGGLVSPFLASINPL